MKITGKPTQLDYGDMMGVRAVTTCPTCGEPYDQEMVIGQDNLCKLNEPTDYRMWCQGRLCDEQWTEKILIKMEIVPA